MAASRITGLAVPMHFPAWPFFVLAGPDLFPGQVVGTVDTISGEDQLHFQLWKERTPQDPEKWLK